MSCIDTKGRSAEKLVLAAGAIILCVSTLFLASGCSDEGSHSQETMGEMNEKETSILLENQASDLTKEAAKLPAWEQIEKNQDPSLYM